MIPEVWVLTQVADCGYLFVGAFRSAEAGQAAVTWPGVRWERRSEGVLAAVGGGYQFRL